MFGEREELFVEPYQSTSLSCSFLARWPLRLLLDLSGLAEVDAAALSIPALTL